MTFAGAEVRERHLVGAADLGIHVVHLPGESVRRKPFAHGVGVKKGPIYLLGRCAEDAMKSDRVCRHDSFSFRWFRLGLSSLRRMNSNPQDSSPGIFLPSHTDSFPSVSRRV